MNKNIKLIGVLLLLISVVALASCSPATAPAQKAEAAGEPAAQAQEADSQAQRDAPDAKSQEASLSGAPDFTVTTTQGRTVSLSENIENGKPTVVYFMASWCSTCAKNWDALNEVYPEFEGKVDFVAVSVDPTDTDEVLAELAQEKGFVFETVAGNAALALDYEVKKQTAKFAVNKDGEVVERHDGALTASEWRDFFNAALGKEAMAKEDKMEKDEVMEKSLGNAPDFSVTTTQGRAVSLSENIENGKPTVVYFMASWCSTCAKNWDALNEVYPEYQNEVDFVAISVDPTDTDSVLEELAQDKGFEFETVAGNPSLALDYEVKKQTAKFAVNAQGEVVERHDGALTADEWRDFFDAALGGAMEKEDKMEKDLSEDKEAMEKSLDNPAPEFSLTTTQGREVSLSQNVEDGKPTVVYFMASWCSTCAKNWNALNEVYPEYEDKVDFIAVSVDPTDTDSVLEELAQDKGFVFETVAGNPSLAVDYKVTKQTAKFAVSKDGEIISRHDGALSEAEWREFFEEAINA